LTLPNERCPDAEHLAALAEGVVVGNREALVKHMRSCAACVEGYAAALALLEQDGEGRRQPAPWPPKIAWAAVAAGLLLALGIPTYLRSRTPAPARSTSAWESTRESVSALPTTAGNARFEPWPQGSSSGYGFAPADPMHQRVRLGVRLADKDWAARRHPGAATDALARLRAEPDALDADTDSDEVALGWHLEWCRLAAQAHLPDVCPAEGDARWSETNELRDPAAQRAWDEVRRQLPEGSSAPKDWTALEAALTQLLEVLT
jgi:hypothetical protein